MIDMPGCADDDMSGVDKRGVIAHLFTSVYYLLVTFYWFYVIERNLFMPVLRVYQPRKNALHFCWLG